MNVNVAEHEYDKRPFSLTSPMIYCQIKDANFGYLASSLPPLRTMLCMIWRFNFPDKDPWLQIQ